MKIIQFIRRHMKVEDAKSPLGVLVLVAMVFLMVGVIAPVFSHPPSLPVPVEATMARYVLPDDLVEVTDSPFSGIDPITHLPLVVETRNARLRLYLVPPGIFMAGSNAGDADERFGAQSTPAPVFISAFYISDVIPNELYERHDPSHRHHRGSYSGGSHADHLPATRVTWKQTDSFLSWLCQSEGVSTNSFRKPREMEYEKASHGGLDCCFPWGESVPVSIKALYSPDRAIGVEEGGANGYGLHSPTENVFCWTEDWMGPYPNTLAALVNPKGPKTGNRKVLRGGTWWIYNLSFRCADRWEAFPDLADDHIGFRVVRDLPVPADMPAWTGRPSLAPRTATRFASLAAANTSSNFCIEEAYRALQQRAQLVGYTLTWPDGSAGPAGEYPPNGFYCADLSNDPVPGTVATNLVQALFDQLSTEGLLDSFVTNQSTELFRYSTNSLPSITGLDTNNYLVPFHALADFIPELKTIPVGLFGVGITSVSGGPLTNTESREAILTSPFFPTCDALTNAVTQLWLNRNWGFPAGGPIGAHANIIVNQPTLAPPTNTGQWIGNMKTGRGKLGRDLAAYPAGNWPVYAVVSGTNAPNVTPFPVDGQFHALGENALGGQIWVSSAKFGDVGDVPAVFECIPTPTMVGRFFSFTGWDLGGVAAITFSFTNEVTGECQGCGTPGTLKIRSAGDFIVPGAIHNAVRYDWTPASPQPNSVKMEVFDKNQNLVRTINDLPITLVPTQSYAEFLWNGAKDDAGVQPLTEAASPFKIKLTGTWSNGSTSDEVSAKVEEWAMDVDIGDKPGGSETMVSGVDERTVNSTNLVVSISLDGNSAVQADFNVKADTEVPGGPSGNKRGCKVTPLYRFYTTPHAPYDIRYKVVIEQMTELTRQPFPRIDIKTLMDGTLNPWDMDPTQSGRQTKGTWEFGVDSNTSSGAQRGLTETYQ